MTNEAALPAEPLPEAVICRRCGYDLRGATSDRCSECGAEIERGNPFRVPWETSSGFNAFVGFCSTMWMVIVRPGRLAFATETETDLSSARWFRRIVLSIFTVCATGLFLTVVWHEGGMNFVAMLPLPGTQTNGVSGLIVQLGVFWSAGAILLPVLPIGLFITCWLATHFDHLFVFKTLSVQSQDRSMTLSRYLSAAIFPLLLAAAWAEYFVYRNLAWNDIPIGLSIALEVVGSYILLIVWLAPARLALALQGGSLLRFFAVSILSAFQWVIAMLLGLMMFPAGVGFAWLMFDSMR